MRAKKIVIILMLLSLMFTLCACGKSKKVTELEELIASIGEVSLEKQSSIEEAQKNYQELSDSDKAKVENYGVLEAASAELNKLLEVQAAIDSYLSFYHSNPSPTTIDYSKAFVDSNLVSQYRVEFEKLQALSIGQDMCPEIKYAESVIKLEDFIQYNDFIVCIYSTKETVASGFTDILDVISAGSKADATVAFSKLNSAAARFEAAEKTALSFDQNAERINEIVKCYGLLKSGATNMGSGLYLGSNVVFNTGKSTVSEQSNVYSILLNYASSVIEDMEVVLGELTR